MCHDANAERLLAIVNHSALKLAGLHGDDYRRALESRRDELSGMLELARHLPADIGLEEPLRAHRQHLATLLERG